MKVGTVRTQKSFCQLIVIEEPANYLQYYVGYLEIINLKNKFTKKFGAEFDTKRFHNSFLTIGPTSFDVVEKWLEYYY